MSTLIKNARLIDPSRGFDAVSDILIRDGKIAALGSIDEKAETIIDARGAIIAPALIDTRSFKIDVAACHAGGIARVCLMPDQTPVLDDPALVDRAKYLGGKTLPVHPFAAATNGLLGTEIAEVGLAKKMGAAAISTGRSAIKSALMMHRLLTYAAALNLTVVSHAEENTLTENNYATESETATRLGLSAAPAFAECLAVERDIRLAEMAKAKIHFGQITTRAALELIRAAKIRGVRVTCGVTPAHIFLNDVSIGAWRTFAKCSPPLREETDRLAVIDALTDGTIDVISSGHDPRTTEQKRVPFAIAAPGMSGAELLLPLAAKLVHNGTLTWLQLFDKLSTAPAQIFEIGVGWIGVGAAADIIIFDELSPWKIDAEKLIGRNRNTAFDAMPVEGKVRATFVGGVKVFG
jgi:dihydroorotase